MVCNQSVKDTAAMLDELPEEANEEHFVIVQHGGNDVT